LRHAAEVFLSPYTPHHTRIDVTQLQRMVEAGVLAEGARVELIDGELIDMAPIGPAHMFAVNTLNRLFFEAGAHKLGIVAVQNAVVLSQITCLQPDLVLLRPREDGYRSASPQGRDALLVIEVADSTYR
jgi:Uma2 family endonuclease